MVIEKVLERKPQEGKISRREGDCQGPEKDEESKHRPEAEQVHRT